jgi:YidC/Oxa1 family membrane protein insertase
LIIITTFILQKMTPMATVDPGQQRMMMIMPVVFGFFFFRLAAGLNLYYMTANIVGIGTQMLINRMVPRAPQAQPPPGRQKQPQASGSGGGGVRNGVGVNQ